MASPRALLSFEAKLMGVMFYPAATQRNLNFLAVKLRRERNNTHDENAVIVCTSQGERLGHIDKHIANSVAKTMDMYDDLKFCWYVCVFHVFACAIIYDMMQLHLSVALGHMMHPT